MPTPGSPNAPYFKGERVTDFLDSLEAHGKAANVPLNDLPGYVLRYVHRKVRHIIESAPCWTTQDWTAARLYLIDLYGSSDRKPRISPDRLRKWVSLHAENRIFIKLKDVDRYYREFTAQSTPLLAARRITVNDANLLFYRGIPPSTRKKIKRKIPNTNQTATTAPAIANVLGYLRSHFDEDGLDIDDEDVELSLDSDEEYESSDTEDEDLPTAVKTSKKQRKKVKFDVKEVPGASPIQPPKPTDIESLTRQMEDLRLGHARQLEDIQRGQAMLLRELSAVRIGNNGGNFNNAGPSTHPPPERRCFICDRIHRVGVQQYCEEAPRLVEEGLAKFAPNGRLMRPDGSDLPRSPPNGGGVSRVLREERRVSQNLKGKAGERRDSPPHMAHYASLQTGGEDFFIKDVFAISSSPPTAFPVTRSQAKDPRFDPMKGNRHDKRTNEEPARTQTPIHRKAPPVPSTSTPQPAQPSNPQPTPHSTVPQPVSQPPTTSREPPCEPLQQRRPSERLTEPRKTQIPQPRSDPTPPQVRPPIHKTSPEPTKVQPPLHPSNTEEGWRSRKMAPKNDATPRDDVEMQDGMRPPPKTTGGYHFTSTIQDMVDGDVVQAKILKTLITLPLKEVIGISADLQKRFAGLTKTRREYSSKTVIAEPMDSYYETDTAYIEEVNEEREVNDYDYEDGQETTAPAYSTVHLSYREDEDLDSVLLRYSSAVKLVTSPLFAMTTGRFGGTLAGQEVTFMVDSGSELNLMSEDLHGRTGIAIDLDGARWSLKGINGGAVPLIGCCREVPVAIGGHRFDHHFFVNSETGKQDVILGQPWLQWYTAALLYSRSGAVEMKVWKAGDRESGERPTISIRLCAANAPRNSDQLVMKGKKATVDIYESDSEN